MFQSEEKCEQIETLKDEIDEIRKQLNKLRNENVDLQQRAALASVYSDELESLRDKTLKVDKYEQEIGKLKEKLEELQANRGELEQLKSENMFLAETKVIIEKQLNEYQLRVLSLQRLDTDVNKYKQELDELYKHREMEKKRLCELCEKNAKLELDMKNLLNQNVNLDEELNYTKQELTFLTAELSKQKQLYDANQQQMQTLLTQTSEQNRLRVSELEQINTDLMSQLKSRDQEMLRLNENLRHKESNLDESLAKIKVRLNFSKYPPNRISYKLLI